MTFSESIQTCFRKYATFDGLASRSEYWWFMLFCWLATMALNVVSPKLGALFGIATLLPSVAAAARRLHETDRSGWWQLLVLIPFVGWIVLIVFLAQEPRPNRYSAAVVHV